MPSRYFASVPQPLHFFCKWWDRTGILLLQVLYISHYITLHITHSFFKLWSWMQQFANKEGIIFASFLLLWLPSQAFPEGWQEALPSCREGRIKSNKQTPLGNIWGETGRWGEKALVPWWNFLLSAEISHMIQTTESSYCFVLFSFHSALVQETFSFRCKHSI